MDRIEFLTLENQTLNRHKGELIEKVWALEAENRKLSEENERLKAKLLSYKACFGA